MNLFHISSEVYNFVWTSGQGTCVVLNLRLFYAKALTPLCNAPRSRCGTYHAQLIIGQINTAKGFIQGINDYQTLLIKP